jgi:predicted outer membrane repeat protein
MSISDSTFTGNSATEGGAIQARSQAIIEVVNTTISGNTANRGGGIEVMGPIAGNAATLRNVTLSNNTAPASGSNAGGGNIAVVGNANLTLQNTIVANPGGGSANCVTQSTGGTLVDGGNNIQYPGATCLAITTVDPKLSALADNGGWTQTHAIAADSPARNAGALPACPAFDQRGVIRPQGVPCDIGAFEYGAVPTITSFSVPCAPASGAAFTLVVTGTNFIPGAKGSKLVVNGTPLATTYLSGTQLRAVVPAGIGGAGRTPLEIAVTTPTVDGGTATRQQVVCLAVYLPSVTN